MERIAVVEDSQEEQKALISCLERYKIKKKKI